MRLPNRLVPLLLLACLAGAAMHASPALAQRGAPPTLGQRELGIHVIQAGDSLFRLAARYHMTATELAALNGIHPEAVMVPGWPLWVPLDKAINARADAPARPAGVGGVTAAAAVPSTQHRVQAGETLFGIARRYGVDVEDLKRWNGLPADGSIQAGSSLVVESPDDRGGSEPGPAPETAPSAGPRGRVAHIVVAGETLSSIADRYGETVVSLQRLNGLADDAIQVGQRLLVPEHGAGLAQAGPGEKRIEVDISEQRMYVWQGETLVWSLVVSTGLPGYPTRRGSFAVQSKIPNAWSSAWQLWMPHWLGIYWAGPSENGIHALPIINGQRLWGGYLGSPISYGCVVLGSADAEQLYNWADIGTPVLIRD
ncbi:MAG: LysM peptidoglycan-binding domain-containing protein [Chloroflexi bacterium]|nr:LysM peptidoglycan-binding domain-containing protein [Chloroflexota bacterium]